MVTDTSGFSPTYRWIIFTAISAVLFRLAMPPQNWGLLSFVAMAPALSLTRGYSKSAVTASGFIVGLAWHSEMPIALATWGPILAFGAWLTSGALVAGAMLACKILESNIRDGRRWLVFPFSWTLTVIVGQELANAPIALSPLLSYSAPDILTLGVYWGFYGNEFFIASVNGLVSSLICRGLAFKRNEAVVMVLLIAGSILMLFREPDQSDPDTTITVYGVQPSISHDDSLKTSWSLYERKRQEDIYHELTSNGLSSNVPGIVTWPEGGISLPILGVGSRLNHLNTLLSGSHSELLATSQEFGLDNKRRNSVIFLNSKGVQDIVHKSLLAPIAEQYLAPGIPKVIKTRSTNIGIAICFEALFDRHYESLATAGAEVFFVLTDDSSFGEAYLSWTHAAYAIAHSAVYARPLIFLNNSGLSLTTDYKGNIVDIDIEGQHAKLYKWDMEVRQQTSIDHHKSALALACLVLFFMSLERKEIYCDWTSFSSPSIGVMAVTVMSSAVVGLGIDAYAQSRSQYSSMQRFYEEQIRRLVYAPPPDQFSPLFEQQEERSCGAAAVAFTLTKMGDMVFEQEILLSSPPESDRGYSMLELVKAIRDRGFSAYGAEINWNDLPHESGIPVIAYLKPSHFVVILTASGDLVVYFDPAQGRVLYEKRAEFEGRWDRSVIYVSYNTPAV